MEPSWLLAAGVPSVVIDLVGFLARNVLLDIKDGVKELNDKVSGHGEKIADLHARVTALEKRGGRR